MRAAKWGRIVLFASEDAVQPYGEELAYCAAKAGVLGLALQTYNLLSKPYRVHRHCLSRVHSPHSVNYELD